jgi:hypothetical protein
LDGASTSSGLAGVKRDGEKSGCMVSWRWMEADGATVLKLHQ